MNTETQESLKSLMLTEQALQAELAKAGSLQQAATILADAARQRGIDVSADDILATNRPCAEGELSDEQLDAVSGGSWFGDFLGKTLTLVAGVPYLVGIGIGELGHQAGKL